MLRKAMTMPENVNARVELKGLNGFNWFQPVLNGVETVHFISADSSGEIDGIAVRSLLAEVYRSGYRKGSDEARKAMRESLGLF